MVQYNELSDETKEYALRYLSRTYGKRAKVFIDNHEPVSDYDMKMICTIQKLKNSYKKFDKSVKTTMLTRYEVDNITATQEVPSVKVAKPKPPKVEIKVTFCPAIKMDGKRCNCKIQNNNPFCGRHSKKR